MAAEGHAVFVSRYGAGRAVDGEGQMLVAHAERAEVVFLAIQIKLDVAAVAGSILMMWNGCWADYNH